MFLQIFLLCSHASPLFHTQADTFSPSWSTGLWDLWGTMKHLPTLYPTNLHFSILIGAWGIDEEGLGLKYSLESTKWHNKYLLHHKCILKVQDFLLSRYCGSSLYLSSMLAWWWWMGRAVVTPDGKSFGSRSEKAIYWFFVNYWTLIIK